MLVLDLTEAGACEGWQPIDDRVMGGVSRSRLRHDPMGFAAFEGVVSADHGGGFASVRRPDVQLGTADMTGYRLDVLGDGKRYKLNLRTDRNFDGVNYQAAFQPVAGSWTTIHIPLGDFVASFRGRTVPEAPPLVPARVCQVGLLIGDRQWGPFRLGLKSIRCESRN